MEDRLILEGKWMKNSIKRNGDIEGSYIQNLQSRPQTLRLLPGGCRLVYTAKDITGPNNTKISGHS